MSIHAARSRVTQARENLDAGRFDLVDSALNTAEQYLAGITDADATALRAEITTLRAELANRPTDEETRAIGAARGKIRAARSRVEERNFYGIDDVLAAAAKYLAPVRPPNRAKIDAEIEAVRAEIEAAQRPAAPAAPAATAAPMGAQARAPSAGGGAVSPPTDEEQRGITAARGKLRAARARIDEDQLLGIEEVVAAAVNYLVAVRPEHRAAVDAEIAAVRAEIDAARKRGATRAPAAPRAGAPTSATSGTSAIAAPTDEEQRGITAARGKLRAARSRIEEDQLLGIDDVITAAVNYLAVVRAEHRAAVDAEIAAVRAEIAAARERASKAAAIAVQPSSSMPTSAIASGPTEEEQRGITAARNKLRTARSRIEEDQLIGIDDVIAAAVKYLAVVRPEHRAVVDAEIAAVRAQVDAIERRAMAVAMPWQTPPAAPPPPPQGWSGAPPQQGWPPPQQQQGWPPPPPPPQQQGWPPPPPQGLPPAQQQQGWPPPPPPQGWSPEPPSLSPSAMQPSPPANAEWPSTPPSTSPPPSSWSPASPSSPLPSPSSSPSPATAARPPAPPSPPPSASPSPPPATSPSPSSPATAAWPPAPPSPSSPATSSAAASVAITPDEEQAIIAARSMMRLARRKLADGQLPGIGDVIMAAAQHLERVRSAHRGAVESELGALRTEIIAMPGGAPALGPAVLSLRLAAGPPSTPPAASAPPAAAPSARGLTEDEQASLSRARGRTIAARSAIESRRFDAAGPALDEALAQLARVPEASSAELRREVEVLRGQLADELRAQDRRKVMDDVERHLRSAESDAEYQHVGTGQEAVQRALRRLEEPDVARMLSPEQVAGYRDRAAALGDMFSATLRSDALARAKPMLEELERAAPEDMFAGMEEYELLRKDRALVTMRVRVLTALRNSAIDDPDIAAIVRRLVAVERRIAAALTTWSTVRRDERVVNDWAAVSRNTSGWTQEAISSGDDPEMLEEPELPKTRFALSRARAQSAYTPRRVGTESDGLPASGEDATATLDPRDMIDHMYRAASTKLAASYIRLLDAAERMAPPLDQFLLRRPAQIAYNAARTLAGTSHRDAIVARAESIDERWRAAYMTATHGTHELYEKLNREADRKWPELRDSSNALPFDLDRTQPGTLIFLERVINRAGWDYHARGVELAVRVDNALVAGVCSPHVKMALQHAVRVQRLDIGDRVPWNVIGIVRNMGMLDVRTHLTLRDHQSGKAVGEEHTWTSTECVNITIIGLQVGPVIVFDMAAANG